MTNINIFIKGYKKSPTLGLKLKWWSIAGSNR